MIGLPEWAYLLLAGVVYTMGTARATRLIVDDTYPPAAWFRDKWRGWTNDGPWAGLVDCAFCAAPYIAAVNGVYAWASDLHWSWWMLNIWATVAYAAAMVVVRDTPE